VLEQLEKLLTAIHATPHMMTMDFAGAGSQALAWLHSVGGSSRTVLEATDRYIPTSLAEAVGYMPEKFTSVETGNALAKHAFERAKKLAGLNATRPGTPVFGVGCTATIATDRAKKGDHRCVVSICDSLGTLSYELVITKGARDRQGEENLVSLLILNAIAEASGIFDIDDLPLAQGEEVTRAFIPAPKLSRLISGELNWLAIAPDGSLTTGKTLPNLAVLSGSFNPLHEGHKKLSVVASQLLNKDVVFELPLINAEKAPIDLAEARKRAVQFLGFDTLLLSRSPLFDQKAEFYPNSTFILGADTAARLVAPRFYGDDVEKMKGSLEHLRSKGAKFLVAGRSSKDDFKTLDDIEIPINYREMFSEIPESAFKMDISSTELRKKMAES
jgi:Cytidylyltransferase-like